MNAFCICFCVRGLNEILFLRVFEHCVSRVFLGGGGKWLARNGDRVVCGILYCYEGKVTKDSILYEKNCYWAGVGIRVSFDCPRQGIKN